MTEQYFVTSSLKTKDEGAYTDGTLFNKYDEAEVWAKKCAFKRQDDCGIFKSYATAKAVVPEIEVVKH